MWDLISAHTNNFVSNAIASYRELIILGLDRLKYFYFESEITFECYPLHRANKYGLKIVVSWP